MRSLKVAAAIATAAVLVLGVGACADTGSGDNAKSGGDTTVTWWVPDWQKDAVDTVLKKFQSERPDIKIERVTTTWATMAPKIQVALNSGNAPDLIDELISRVTRYAIKDQLLDISKWFDAKMPVDDFYESAIGASSLDGKIYAVPYRWDASALIYNKDMFAKAGIDAPPATWAELQEDAKALKAIGVYAYGWPYGNDNSTSTRWLDGYYTEGGTFKVDKTGAVTIDPSASERSLEMLKQGYSEKLVTPSSFESDNTAVQNLLINKQIAFYNDGAYAIDPIRKAGINIGTAMWPGPDGPAKVSADGFAWIVPKSTKHAEAVKALTQFLALPENEAILTATFPGRLSAAKDKRFSDPLLQPFLEQQTKYAVSKPNFVGWDTLIPTIFSSVQSVVLGNKSVSEANKAIVDQAANIRAK